MSLFSWFSRKPSPSKPRSPIEPSGLLNADATVPLAVGRNPALEPRPVEHAANRKNERMERRELLYTVVRHAMVRAGVLSASYKFKVLSLDQRGRQFLVMMDLAREFGGETVRLSEIEALIARTAKARYDILVTAVYWRINDHVAVGIPQKGIAGWGPRCPQPLPQPVCLCGRLLPWLLRCALPGRLPPQRPLCGQPPLRRPAPRLLRCALRRATNPSRPTKWRHSSARCRMPLAHGQRLPRPASRVSRCGRDLCCHPPGRPDLKTP